MIATGGVSAVLVAVNVKPQALAGDDGLLQSVPVMCRAEGSEWSCVMYSRLGASDGAKRQGGPVSVVLQQIVLKEAHVKEAPSESDVLVWTKDAKEFVLRSAVCIPCFPDFAGCTGKAPIDLDVSMVCTVFQVWNRDEGF
jgi:hypothetical protein